jgi:hypothetical protein
VDRLRCGAAAGDDGARPEGSEDGGEVLERQIRTHDDVSFVAS